MTTQAIPENISSVPQPPRETWRFAEELRTRETRRFHAPRGMPREGEADLRRGVRVRMSFPDARDVLRTAVSDLNDFFRETGIPAGNGPYEIRMEQDSGVTPWDSFEIEVAPERCVIRAALAEGIRRGIYHLEDLLLGAGGPFLPAGLIRRRAWLKNRISRCFFSPVRRAPDFRGELDDETDYYPEAYLDRLAHEGVNGLWIQGEFSDLCRVPEIPEWGVHAATKLEKLLGIVEKCASYGIRVFLLTIEPCAFSADSPVLKRHPELDGAVTGAGTHCFCPSSGKAHGILSAAVRSIFLAVPGLGGIINISLGERTTSCLSSLSPFLGSSTEIRCPRCASLQPEEILYRSVSAMAEGMRSVSPDAEFISWIYRAQDKPVMPWITELSRKVPEGVIFLYNFESGIEAVQQGGKRVGGDYWLSLPGPSARFETVARNLAPGGQLGAKIQTCSSHECATVPFLPVPGLLYRKYEAMRRLGVTTCLMCWYFGNYPGLMNRAAGMLAFEEFTGGEDDFLCRLASPQWRGQESGIAEVWKKAAEAYSQYPLSNAMQYYGPCHDGIVWPLYPTAQYRELAMTWVPDMPVSGDHIGDCLQDFTLNEAEAQTRLLAGLWDGAFAEMRALRKETPAQKREYLLMEALGILFRSAERIFRFYRLRGENGSQEEMKRIMREEAAASERMAELCAQLPSLGFHSESVSFRFFPEKLHARAALLRSWLKTPPPPLRTDADYTAGDGLVEAEDFSWEIDRAGNSAVITLRMRGDHETDEMFVGISAGCEKPPLCLALNRRRNCVPAIPGIGADVQQGNGFWQAALTLPHALTGHSFRIGFLRSWNDPGSGARITASPEVPRPVRPRLRYGYVNVRRMWNVRLCGAGQPEQTAKKKGNTKGESGRNAKKPEKKHFRTERYGSRKTGGQP